MPDEIRLYATAHCSPCRRAKTLLTRLGLPFVELRVDLDDGSRAEMERTSGRMTVPQVFVGATHIGGCDDLYALEASGDLARILARHGYSGFGDGAGGAAGA